MEAPTYTYLYIVKLSSPKKDWTLVVQSENKKTK